MIHSLLRTGQKVKIYFGNESDYIVSTIIAYYEEYGLIKIAINELILPLEIIAKIEPMGTVSGYASNYAKSCLSVKQYAARRRKNSMKKIIYRVK